LRAFWKLGIKPISDQAHKRKGSDSVRPNGQREREGVEGVKERSRSQN